MKCFCAALVLPSTAPVSAQTGSCDDTECFYDQQVRDFQVISDEKVIVYVGNDRCPFLVTVSGFFCDLEYVPEIDFYNERERRTEAQFRRRRGDPGELVSGSVDTSLDRIASNDRICPGSAPQYALDTFGFGPFAEDEIPVNQAACPVQSVVRINDDDLVELYTRDGMMAPPPPVGNGTISRTDDADRAAQ